jgi:hypothetical protein
VLQGALRRELGHRRQPVGPVRKTRELVIGIWVPNVPFWDMRLQ